MVFDKSDLNLMILDVAKFHYCENTSYADSRNYCAISYREKADTEIIWNGKHLKLESGSVTFFPSNLKYLRKSKEDIMIVIHLDISNYISYDIQSVLPKNNDEIKRLFNKILTVWTEKRNGYRYEANAVLYKIFSTLFNQSTSSNLTDDIRSALDYIHKNYTNSSLSIDSISHIVGISNVYFRKRFKEQLGKSPKKYIIDLKLEHAKTLLNMDGVSVAQAAESSGFNDVKYFSTLFSQKMGYPPSKQKYTSL